MLTYFWVSARNYHIACLDRQLGDKSSQLAKARDKREMTKKANALYRVLLATTPPIPSPRQHPPPHPRFSPPAPTTTTTHTQRLATFRLITRPAQLWVRCSYDAFTAITLRLEDRTCRKIVVAWQTVPGNTYEPAGTLTASRRLYW